jgi:hypothetical protein
MITIKVEGVNDLLSRLDRVQRKVPYAIANGINAVAQKVMDAEKEGMRQSFDRPTPFTMNSLRITRARFPNLEAKVFFKDPPNLSQKDHYLLPQVEGGSRPKKPFEMGLGGRYTVPGKGLVLDQYGNLSRGQLTRILSQSGSFRESGFKMNRTRKGNKSGDMFMLTKQRGKMPPGIYARVSTGSQISRATAKVAAGSSTNHTLALKKTLNAMNPRGLRPVLIFPTKAPTYRKRFDFYGIGRKIVEQQLRPEIAKAVQAEIDHEISRGRW